MNVVRGTRTVILAAAVAFAAMPALLSAAGAPLEGTQWRLMAWSASSLRPDNFKITAVFAEGRMSGHSGVNTYGGPCKLGPGAAFAAGPLMASQMAGSEAATRAEGIYFALLEKTASHEIADGKLCLLDKQGSELLVFEAAGHAADRRSGPSASSTAPVGR